LYFAGPDWWVTDIDSFTNQAPAQLSIQALEDSELLVIGKTDKERLYAMLPKVEKLFRIMTQKTLVALQRRLIGTHSLSAEERYLRFFSAYPEIARRLTNVHVASYLGVTPEFVSKIRRVLATRR
jgi:CRP-like cAMP-binding protein